MNRYSVILVSLALVSMVFAGTASATTDENREQAEKLLEMRDRYDGQVD
jgi:hypothetical protein